MKVYVGVVQLQRKQEMKVHVGVVLLQRKQEMKVYVGVVLLQRKQERKVYVGVVLLQRKQERKVYADEDIDDDEIEGKRLFSVEEKLASNKYHHKFAKQLKGHGTYQ